jgi:hypothetical protein
MGKRMKRRRAASRKSAGAATADVIEQRVVAFAEQLGRLIGAAQARADGLVDTPALQKQVTRIRKGATSLLKQLGGGRPARRRKARPKATARAKKGAARTKPNGSRRRRERPGKKLLT